MCWMLAVVIIEILESNGVGFLPVQRTDLDAWINISPPLEVTALMDPAGTTRRSERAQYHAQHVRTARERIRRRPAIDGDSPQVHWVHHLGTAGLGGRGRDVSDGPALRQPGRLLHVPIARRALLAAHHARERRSSASAKVNTQAKKGTSAQRWISPIHRVSSLGACGGSPSWATLSRTTAATMIVPHASVHH